jgi:hypothetical protein
MKVHGMQDFADAGFLLTRATAAASADTLTSN